MNTRKVSGLLSVMVFLLINLSLLAGCSGDEQPTANQKVLNVAMILAKGGLGDRSFNDSAYTGLQEAQKRYGVRFKTVDFSNETTNLENLRQFAREEYDLIIGIGFENGPLIETVAKEFSNRKFAIIDTEVRADNVAAIIYREQEGDFLMGVLSARLTQTRKVGFIGGVDMAITRRIESGFRQGLRYQNDQVEMVSDITGTFSDAAVGKRAALTQYAQGVDIIYNAAGRTGLGIIEAAKETGKLTVGTSGEQIYLAPDNVVGNRRKRMDSAVLALIEDVRDARFTPGVRALGLKENGLAIGPLNDRLVSKEIQADLERIRQEIINGTIIVKAADNP